MPGFVSVANMSDQEVKRMWQTDESSDYKPAARTRRSTPKANSVKHSAADVWAAASAALRINQGYYKETVYSHQGGDFEVPVKPSNRQLMMQLLSQPADVTSEDRAMGASARNYLKQDLTFRALKGRLTDFDQSSQKALALDEFETDTHRFELAIAACLPNSYMRALDRQAVQDKLQQAQGGFIGQPGDRVTVNVVVLRSVYSQKFNVNYITAIDSQDRPVLFSCRESFDPNTGLTISGTVKVHRDNLTQLYRVKVL